ncbi:helix-turn-helix transcriptional regulator [Brachybacterium phenoliresistens]|uniref:helix-turn-helix domain-containing protein n=1 Tax=Brachybacterium phenoliresistens TaxID=396014 RepID=UPI0031D201D6
MHAYLRFVRTEMDKRGWSAADLGRASGLTAQHLSRILNDDRDVLQRRPESATIDALARAFGMSSDYVLTFVAEAMGFPSGRVSAPDASALSDEELLHVLAERLRRARTNEHEGGTAESGSTAGGGDVEDPAQPDGITAGERGGAGGRSWPRVPATPEMLEDDRELRVLREGLELAAREGKIDLDEQHRDPQDRDAEAGGA